MTTFVLVHGAWHGSWCWQRVRAALQDRGHRVFTPTLTGLGERSHLLHAEVDLEMQIHDVLNLILWEELDDFVLCGHSYGGFVVSGVADRVPQRVRSLVFLDAFLPDDGDSLVRFAPISPDQVIDGWKVTPIPAAVFGVNEADRAWVDRQCTPQSIACFERPIRLRGGLDSIRRIEYVYASGWAGGESPFAPFRRKAEARGWRIHDVACGHDVMLDQPAVLTDLLLEAAGGAA